MSTTLDSLRNTFEESRATFDAFLADGRNLEAMAAFAEAAHTTLEAGGRLLSCGNGGSMSDAMHFAEEWSGRFRNNRRPLSAIALSDPAAISCIANDFGYEAIFSRQVEAHGREGDLLLAISTSGESANVLAAVKSARQLGMRTVGLLGKGGGKVAGEVDIAIVVPRATTADRIQELHIQVIHAVIEAVERRLFPENYVG